jgi:hypothetical protein
MKSTRPLLAFTCQRRRKPLLLTQMVKPSNQRDNSCWGSTMTSRRVVGQLIAICFGTIVLLESPASADLITISNASFENPVLANGATTTLMPDWNRLGPGGILNPSAAQFAGGLASHGENVAFLGTTTTPLLFQNLAGTNLALGTYTFQFDVGNRLDEAIPNLNFSFLVNATTFLPLQSSNTPTVPDGEFRTWTFTYKITPTLNFLLGDPTRIRFLLSNTSAGGSMVIDNVRGSYSVPEPGSLVPALLAALAIVSRRRRSRQSNGQIKWVVTV